ncbi:hypothetical protein K501DRAFT_284638 [Backusella circina FSU 941]|nr:hypothetical protein K501DRAFT_284638 [Backusella circina FSU 941]
MRVLFALFLLFVVSCQAQLVKRIPQAVGGSSQAQAPAATSSNNNAAATSAAAQPSAAATSAGVAVSGSAAPAASTVVLTTAAGSANASANAAASNSVNALPTSASYGNSVYPGTASFVTPTVSKSVSPLYKIDPKENVTFIWSFTDLLVRPQNLTLAAVGPNSVTYTISAMEGAATSAVWHISDVPAASPLMMGDYQVQLYDQRGPTAAGQPGWLSPVTRLTIAFYSAESYQPATGSGYCPTCFYSAGFRLSESFGPIAFAFGVACATSAMFIYNVLM